MRESLAPPDTLLALLQHPVKHPAQYLTQHPARQQLSINTSMRKSSRPPKLLQTMQVNVGKGGLAHEAALNLASEREIDIVLIQEPYIHKDLDRCISKKHPTYNCFTPIEKWDQQP